MVHKRVVKSRRNGEEFIRVGVQMGIDNTSITQEAGG
jgi:hypothetical protein